MRIIQTFWTGHSKIGDNLFDLKAGWLSSEYHWMSWTLSCLQIKKFYPRIELITDKVGKEILIDSLLLPYTSVSTELENSLDKYPAELWSLAKIFSYSIQNKQFIHLDGDVFLWKPLDEKFSNADIGAQNLEINLSYYEQSWKEINNHFAYLPDVLKQKIKDTSKFYASNTGIFGGRDISFIKFYCDTAFAFIDKNIEMLGKVNKANLNFMFEQCFLYYLAKAQNRPITYLIKKPVTEPSYIDYARFIDIPNVKMIHTVGGYKRMKFICDHLARRLRKEYPEYYYHIINLCKQNNIILKNSIYSYSNLNDDRLSGFNNIAEVQGDVKYSKNGNTLFADKKVDQTPFQKIFFRTLAALKFLRSQESSSQDQVFQMPGNIDQLYDIIHDPNKKEKRLIEVFNLENKKYQLLNKLEDNSFIYSLYNKDIVNYEQTENLFLKSKLKILNTAISVESSVSLMELKWNWNYNPKGMSLEKFIEDKFREKPSPVQTVLIFSPLKLLVNEVYLDDIDTIIVNVFSDNIIVKDALEFIKQYFDPEDVKNGYNKYQKLILDSIKRLMYEGILTSN